MEVSFDWSGWTVRMRDTREIAEREPTNKAAEFSPRFSQSELLADYLIQQPLW